MNKKSINHSVFVFSVIMPSLALAQQFESFDIRSWVDEDSYLMVEAASCREWIQAFPDLQLFQHPDWDLLQSRISDPDFGLVSQPDLAKVFDQLTTFADGITPQQAMIIVNNDFTWDVAVKVNPSVDEQIVKGFLSELAPVVDAVHRRLPGRALTQKKRDAVPRTVVEVDDITIHQLTLVKPVFWFCHSGMLICSSSKASCERLAKKISGQLRDYRRLVESRRFRTLVRHVRNSHDSEAMLGVYISPEMTQQIAGQLLDDSWADFGRTELQGFYGTLSLVPSQRDEDHLQFAADSMLLVALPRRGIATALKPHKQEIQLPPMPGRMSFFAMANIDFLHFHETKQELVDHENGDGSFERQLLWNGRLSGDLADRYLKSWWSYWAETGRFRCRYRLALRDGTSIRFDASQTPDCQKFFDAVRSMQSVLTHVSPTFSEWLACDFGSYPGLLSAATASRSRRFGCLYREAWVIQAQEAGLRALVDDAFDHDSHDSNIQVLTQQLEHLTSHIARPNDNHFALLVTWSHYWENFRQSLLVDYVKGKHSAAQITGVFENIDEFSFDQPDSKSDNNKQIKLIFWKIVNESMGNVVLVCSDSHFGFRLSGMTFDR